MPSSNPQVRFRVTPEELARIEDRKPMDESTGEFCKRLALADQGPPEAPDPEGGSSLRAAGSPSDGLSIQELIAQTARAFQGASEGQRRELMLAIDPSLRDPPEKGGSEEAPLKEALSQARADLRASERERDELGAALEEAVLAAQGDTDARAALSKRHQQAAIVTVRADFEDRLRELAADRDRAVAELRACREGAAQEGGSAVGGSAASPAGPSSEGGSPEGGASRRGGPERPAPDRTIYRCKQKGCPYRTRLKRACPQHPGAGVRKLA